MTSAYCCWCLCVCICPCCSALLPAWVSCVYLSMLHQFIYCLNFCTYTLVLYGLLVCIGLCSRGLLIAGLFYTHLCGLVALCMPLLVLKCFCLLLVFNICPCIHCCTGSSPQGIHATVTTSAFQCPHYVWHCTSRLGLHSHLRAHEMHTIVIVRHEGMSTFL